AGAARLFGLTGKGRIAAGFDADFSIVDLTAEWTVEDSWLASRCGWSPFTGYRLKGRPVGTIVRGRRVMWEAELIGSPVGEPIRFDETIRA
ncbi:MAG: amidohydrolase family protein, partial [Sphingomonadaceae bacterium]|nr:amidohydrolase family protein [Sphingomonadaceae bacterium]